MKKILIIAIWIVMFCSLQSNIAYAQEEEWFWTHRWVEWIGVVRTQDPGASDEALHIAIKVINWILSLTSVVAIIIFLIWGFKVLTSNWDDTKAKGWYKIIKNAIIWLLIIWLTRWIVRIIFWLVNWMAWVHDFNWNWW